MATGFSLKDQLFNLDKTRYLAGLFQAADPSFDATAFEAEVMARLLDLELKERIQWIADVLGTHLAGDLPEIAPQMLKALPPPLDPNLSDDDFGDFIFAPLGELVVAKGLVDHPDLSLDLLHAITQRFSMEWAIRPFLNQWQDLTLARMALWAQDSNYHVRRLASEGSRPRLPWGQSVGLDLADPLPILDQLHRDPTRYVTRSVANHLNDITKKDPDLVLDRLKLWGEQGQQSEAELRWMTTHALRGLIKDGHPEAMRMLGYHPDAPVAVDLTLARQTVAIGEALQITCTVTADDDLPVLVDYCLYFPTPAGKTRRKVFKLKQAKLKGGTLTLAKKHPLKGNASTFSLHPGPHRIELMVNGVVRAEHAFNLEAQK
ncbi:hypothetical protein GFB49_03555 [Epibacterium sp. SM1979]|uniref:DNA alkylation repair enzyme n=1 Tax=Tritonibacter litoralis TaxID=2662264 RepID=A0A843Y8I6_9RHOB|nr:hypothetical protein [Tritonibacter litoralis]MQQ07520.1 hypothetical protein [Tritonibacter litoralis]